MSHIRNLPIIVLVLGLNGAWADTPRPVGAGGHVSPRDYPALQRLWAEEFSGGQLNGDSWTLEPGSKARVQDGYLLVTGGALLSTRGKRGFRPARVDIRARLPAGPGWQTSLRLLAAGGEVGVMQASAAAADEIRGSLRWREGRGARWEGGSVTLPSRDLAEQFHVFSVTRDETGLRWFLDGYEFMHQATGPSVLPGPLCLEIGLEVSGAFNVESKPFVVDYVRAFGTH